MIITDYKSLQLWVANKLAEHKTLHDKLHAKTDIVLFLMNATGKAEETIINALKDKSRDRLAACNYALINAAIERGEI
jgi:hypothetical protein